MYRIIYSLILAISVMLTSQAIAANCPDQTIRTGIYQGKYLGTFQNEEGPNTLGVKTDDGKEHYIMAGADEGEQLFGTKTGVRIAVMYRVDQFAANGQCQRIEVLTGGQKLTEGGPVEQKQDAAQNPNAISKIAKFINSNKRVMFYSCNGNGNSPKTMCISGKNLTVEETEPLVLNAGIGNSGSGFWKGYRSDDTPCRWETIGDTLHITTNGKTTIYGLIGDQFFVNVDNRNAVMIVKNN